MIHYLSRCTFHFKVPPWCSNLDECLQYNVCFSSIKPFGQDRRADISSQPHVPDTGSFSRIKSTCSSVFSHVPVSVSESHVQSHEADQSPAGHGMGPGSRMCRQNHWMHAYAPVHPACSSMRFALNILENGNVDSMPGRRSVVFCHRSGVLSGMLFQNGMNHADPAVRVQLRCSFPPFQPLPAPLPCPDRRYLGTFSVPARTLTVPVRRRE